MRDWEVEMVIDGVVISCSMVGETAADVIEEILSNEDNVEIRKIRLVLRTV
jgi:hypothetical protein